MKATGLPYRIKEMKGL